MAKITTNFSFEEFKCKDGSDIPQKELSNIIVLAKQLQILRDKIGKSITINSAYRSPKHNAKIGGVKNSQHVKGKAADIKVNGMSTKQLALIIEELIKKGQMLEGGIGIYPTFVHYDIRGTKARW